MKVFSFYDQNDGLELLKGDKGGGDLTGTDGNDTLDGTKKADSIDGGGGDDTLSDSLGGDDTLIGGDGNDTITVTRTDLDAKDHISIDGGAGDDIITYTGDIGVKAVVDITTGDGANVVSVTNAFNDYIVGGADADTMTVTTSHYAVLRGEDGDDVLNVSNTDGDARTGVVSGAGADTLNFSGDNDPHYRAWLQAGDVANLGAASGASDAKLVFYSFAAGDDGSQLNISDYLDSVLIKPHDDLFADGHLKLVDGVTAGGQNAAILEMDVDGKKGPAEFVTLAVFIGVEASDLTAFNLGGIAPEVSTASADHADPFVI